MSGWSPQIDLHLEALMQHNSEASSRLDASGTRRTLVIPLVRGGSTLHELVVREEPR